MPVFRSKFKHCRKGKIVSARVAHSFAALLLCVFCIATSVASAAPVQSTDEPGIAESQQSSIIAATVPEESEKAAFPHRLGFGRLDGEFSKEDLRRRPLLYFRMWANKPLPLVPSFLFLLFISLVASEVMPARMEVARQYYTNHYWKSLWSGLISCLLFTTLARALFASEIGVPLATVSLAALQFFVLIGVAISSTLIGQTILSVFGPKQSIAVKRPWFERLAAPLVGSLLMSLLLVIPPLGILPRIGIRLIMLLSFLGMGAWFRTEMGTKELGGSSET